MTKTAAVKDPTPAEARAAVVARVLARRPPDVILTYANPAAPDKPFKVIRQADGDRLPPASLPEWCDDRVMGVFGSRVALTSLEQAGFDILESMRDGQDALVRQAVGKAGRAADHRQRYLLYGQLNEWAGKAGQHAMGVTAAALSEAQRLGWHVPPRRRGRAA
jgi:hypothetical protein